MHIVLITGISGSGKSVALNVLEDADYYCVDNLPTEFLPQLVDFLCADGHDRLAVAIDARAGQSVALLPDMISRLREQHDVRVLFLSADDETLVQRFSETRRRHPLSGKTGRHLGPGDATDARTTLVEAIQLERELIGPMAAIGHQIDTSNLRSSALRGWVKEFIRHDGPGLTLMFESFGFKYGVPRDADLVFDVRSLPNPHYDPQLKPLTGLDATVAEYLQSQPMVLAMADDIRAFVEKWLPTYIDDNRSYLTVAIGCTGGQHRSVYIAERLAAYFGASREVLVRHRQMPPSASA